MTAAIAPSTASASGATSTTPLTSGIAKGRAIDTTRSFATATATAARTARAHLPRNATMSALAPLTTHLVSAGITTGTTRPTCSSVAGERSTRPAGTAVTACTTIDIRAVNVRTRRAITTSATAAPVTEVGTRATISATATGGSWSEIRVLRSSIVTISARTTVAANAVRTWCTASPVDIPNTATPATTCGAARSTMPTLAAVQVVAIPSSTPTTCTTSPSISASSAGAAHTADATTTGASPVSADATVAPEATDTSASPGVPGTAGATSPGVSTPTPGTTSTVHAVDCVTCSLSSRAADPAGTTLSAVPTLTTTTAHPELTIARRTRRPRPTITTSTTHTRVTTVTANTMTAAGSRGSTPGTT